MLLDDLTARFLREFSAVAQSGSIRSAARQMNIVPSAISRKISDAEVRLGVKLLERRPNGVMLTRAGEILAQYAAKAAEDQSELMGQLSRLQSSETSPVRIACSEAFISDLMENGVRPLLKVRPDINVQVLRLSSPEVQDALLQGAVDIGIAYGLAENAMMRTISSGRQPLCAIFPVNAPFARRKQVEFAEVVGLPLALVESDHPVRFLLSRAAREQNLILSPRLESNSVAFLLNFVTAEIGITFLPRCVADAPAMKDKIAAVAVSDTVFLKTETRLMVRARRRLEDVVETVANRLATDMLAFSST
ncbi:LysR family transcriptional regulator [Martelella mediterranea]|uniref:LysR family transcriptional regulator n=2 Tax=Martelella mediterranea TaxID=293089 RepID=A0A4R3P1S3_9HYPH|nr:LysR family transcriptional regulator [Martelella mediterranea]